MTTAQETTYIREVEGERLHQLCERGYIIQSYHQWFSEHIYLPVMNKTIEDMRIEGLLPKEPL